MSGSVTSTSTSKGSSSSASAAAAAAAAASSRPYIDVDDLDLAVSTHLTESFVSPPPRELLYAMAQQRNSVPLPVVPTREGVHLPADKFCLMQPNYRVKTAQAGRRDEHKSHI